MLAVLNPERILDPNDGTVILDKNIFHTFATPLPVKYTRKFLLLQPLRTDLTPAQDASHPSYTVTPARLPAMNGCHTAMLTIKLGARYAPLYIMSAVLPSTACGAAGCSLSRCRGYNHASPSHVQALAALKTIPSLPSLPAHSKDAHLPPHLVGAADAILRLRVHLVGPQRGGEGAVACPKQPAAARGLGRTPALLIRRRAKHAREGDALAAAALRGLTRRG